MNHRILEIEDVIALFRSSRATIDRWVREARDGKSDFPIPFSPPGRRMLWDAHVIERWLENRNKAAPPVNVGHTRFQRIRLGNGRANYSR